MVDLLEGHRVLAFDLETTGISTNNDKIVQVALIGADTNNSEINYNVLVNPQRPIPIEATRVHGIHDSDTRDKPVFKYYAQELFELMDGAVIVGHNARRFDMPLLENEFFRCGMIPPKPKVLLDTLECVRRLKIARPHNLGAQCALHGIDLANAHDAAADAAACLLLLWKLMLNHPASFRRSLEDVEHWLINGEARKDESALGRSLNDLIPFDSEGRIRLDEGVHIIAFGRHRGKDLKTIEDEDPKYVDWLLSSNGIEDESARDSLRDYISSIRDR
ncbi:MAG: 3'-5' exonuclease [Candidatus Poseidoniaceae archaeon]|jgi:DNA polymerase-3 subunit epsilon|nr:3'-5' exonuclease [Candidatus Poseidoniaceae archaeon]